MRRISSLTRTVVILLIASTSANAADRTFPVTAQRILFLGDSITHAGNYIARIESRLRLAGDEHVPEMINAGLPSETCSGLSEPDHPFPRPTVHERLDRALAKANADVVVACYGMNDGIYYPFSEERFAAYRDGIDLLIRKVHATGAKLVLMTPPAFDPLPLKKKGKLLPPGAEKYAWFAIYENYDVEVLRRYAEWIVAQRDRVDMVIDLHTPVTRYVADKRRSDPEFTMSPDGVHVNHEGHTVLARAILDAWKIDREAELPADLLKLVTQRQLVLHNAWLSHIGHKRPGVKPGLPIDDAVAKASELDRRITALLK